ncbi:hypothetical protein LAUMK136_00483 [Mycobacterium attenuatum]|uniref:Uncharacterized protein n=1 Tax=Mycobacterium attenuatum TaxID=2341086 RepID=A0A498PNY9_9MYCO|nr:hypothetical protein LAUMK136_00483 [Mycobacterium attenuatum]
MRGQGGVELRRLGVRQGDPPTAELFVAGLGDRGRRLRPRIGVRSRFKLDRGAQLVDRGHPRQLRVVLIGSHTGPGGDDANLIQRQPALFHARRAARKLRPPARHRGDRVSVDRRAAQLPGHQRRHRPRPRHPTQLVAIDLGHDLRNAPIDRVALTGQLRQLLKQHLQTPGRTDHHGVRRCTRRHDLIIAATTDNSRPPNPARGVRHHWPRGTA